MKEKDIFTVKDGVLLRHPTNFNLSIKEVVLPEGVTSIGNNAFILCNKLEKIIIPEGVERIESGAFWCCSGLTEIVFPETLKYIGENAFYE